MGILDTCTSGARQATACPERQWGAPINCEVRCRGRLGSGRPWRWGDLPWWSRRAGRCRGRTRAAHPRRRAGRSRDRRRSAWASWGRRGERCRGRRRRRGGETGSGRGRGGASGARGSSRHPACAAAGTLPRRPPAPPTWMGGGSVRRACVRARVHARACVRVRAARERAVAVGVHPGEGAREVLVGAAAKVLGHGGALLAHAARPLLRGNAAVAVGVQLPEELAQLHPALLARERL